MRRGGRKRPWGYSGTSSNSLSTSCCSDRSGRTGAVRSGKAARGRGIEWPMADATYTAGILYLMGAPALYGCPLRVMLLLKM